ncbi:hypothetical protein [Burkholderia savannae]|uniref:hypothetical protein n=1 Tax=Burkholderia savannae TaxID=1637837 RepID=UPI0012E3A41C|nr:hypothetical protein [Burkholderia savannae]
MRLSVREVCEARRFDRRARRPRMRSHEAARFARRTNARPNLNGIRHRLILLDTARHGSIRLDTARYGSIRLDTARYGESSRGDSGDSLSRRIRPDPQAKDVPRSASERLADSTLRITHDVARIADAPSDRGRRAAQRKAGAPQKAPRKR